MYPQVLHIAEGLEDNNIIIKGKASSDERLNLSKTYPPSERRV